MLYESRVEIRIKKETDEKLKAMAKRKDRKRSAMARILIEEGLKRGR